ncbi:MAG: DUF2510 domain-containing protein [Actinomycetota bacterium]|nr:DUF2510 domain-containing protein [Actinomycetota bacterium]
MTDQATRVVPAGWYQDPALSEQVRWWNGLAWTEHVREKPTVAPSPASTIIVTASSTSTVAMTDVAGAATAEITASETMADRIAAARELERQFGVGTSENEVITGATALGFGGGAQQDTARQDTAKPSAAPQSANVASNNPAAQRAAAEQNATGRRRAGVSAPRSATGSAWLIALTPVLTLLTGIAAAYVFFYVAETPVVFVLAFLLPYLLVFLWALSDRRALKSREFRSPSPLWAFLGGIGYLIARRVKVAGAGPLAMFLVAGALVLAIPAAAYATGEVRRLSYALTIQNTITSDYLSAGRAVTINCPPFVDTTRPGTLFACTATFSTGVTKSVPVSIDGTAGQFSYQMAF